MNAARPLDVNACGAGMGGLAAAALLAAAIVANSRDDLRERLIAFRTAQTERVLASELP